VSAFDWSPGGCCCNTGGWFDIYAKFEPAGPFVRRASMLPANVNDVDGHDSSVVDWSIPPGGPGFMTAYAASDDAVWTFLGSGLSRYDAAAKVRRFNIPWNIPVGHPGGRVIAGPMPLGSGQTTPTFAPITAISATTFTASQQEGNLHSRTVGPAPNYTYGTPRFKVTEVGLTGVITDWGFRDLLKYEFVEGINNQSGSTIWAHRKRTYWQGVAGGAWPKVGGVRQNFFNTTIGSSIGLPAVTHYVELMVGDVSRDGTDHFSVGGQVVKRVEYSANLPHLTFGFPPVFVTTAVGAIYANWLHLDADSGGWAGLFEHDTRLVPTPQAPDPLYQTHFVLMANGVTIRDFTVTGGRRIVGDGQGNPDTLGVGIPHVCHGSGNIAVVQKMYATPPSIASPNGTLQETLRPWAVVIYSPTGSVLWQSPLLNARPSIHGSSATWLYFSSGETFTTNARVHEMTGGQISGGGPGFGAGGGFGNWIAKHNGSEVIPLGQVSNTYKEIWPSPDSPPLGLPYNIVRGELPFGLPNSYEEMWETRNS
jgi:hypothetical protein